MKCKCKELNELNGLEAQNYTRNHLKEIRVEGEIGKSRICVP